MTRGPARQRRADALVRVAETARGGGGARARRAAPGGGARRARAAGGPWADVPGEHGGRARCRASRSRSAGAGPPTGAWPDRRAGWQAWSGAAWTEGGGAGGPGDAPAAWPATPCCSGWCVGAAGSRSPSDARCGWPPARSGAPWPPRPRVRGARAAAPRPRRATPTTSATGPTGARPTWPTSCCCAAPTTRRSTPAPGRWSWRADGDTRGRAAPVGRPRPAATAAVAPPRRGGGSACREGARTGAAARRQTADGRDRASAAGSLGARTSTTGGAVWRSS